MGKIHRVDLRKREGFSCSFLVTSHAVLCIRGEEVDYYSVFYCPLNNVLILSDIAAFMYCDRHNYPIIKIYPIPKAHILLIAI